MLRVLRGREWGRGIRISRAERHVPSRKLCLPGAGFLPSSLLLRGTRGCVSFGCHCWLEFMHFLLMRARPEVSNEQGSQQTSVGYSNWLLASPSEPQVSEHAKLGVVLLAVVPPEAKCRDVAFEIISWRYFACGVSRDSE